MSKRHLRVFLLSFIVPLLFIPPTISAQAGFKRADCTYTPTVEWRQVDTQSFAILIPPGEQGALVLSGLPPAWIDGEYTRFEALFGASLARPVSLRVYPDQDTYTCLNPGAAELGAGALTGHIGQREIALFAANIAAVPATWQSGGLDLVRYELAVMFTEAVAGEAPPGLLAAIGHYAQDPSFTIGTLQLSSWDWGNSSESWRDLWEAPPEAQNLRMRLLGTSSVAYLIDQNGWGKFLEFLGRQPALNSYNLALQQVYGQDLAALEEGWRAYLPRYFQGRWQANAFYNLDLTPYETLLKSEKYAEAARGLAEAMQHLEKSRQTDKLVLARSLYERARAGNTAEGLVADSQAAFAAGDYGRALDLLDQAQSRYALVGNYYRADELHAYNDQLRKILVLHLELDGLQAELAAGGFRPGLSSRLLELDTHLRRLGDPRGQLRVRKLAGSLQGRQQQDLAWLGLGVVLMVLGLLSIRIWMVRRPPAPEAQL